MSSDVGPVMNVQRTPTRPGVAAGRHGVQDDVREGITADTALRLARYFGTTDRFWLNLQTRYDL